MSGNLKDILSNLNPDIDQETLMRYLQGQLSAEQQHEVEKQMMDSEFDSDALEGLKEFKNKRNINHLVEQLNRDLKKRTDKKKKFRKKMQLQIEPWIIAAVVMILVLVVIAFFVISRMKN
ncbi:MAG: hypothetical protein ACXWB9_04030 [Flavisolibacter sp.]